jgi:2-hydroxychromene-2-carboxylate isomerase
MKHVPVADKPAKTAYMWRDIERRAAMYGFPGACRAVSRELFWGDDRLEDAISWCRFRRVQRE